MDRLEELRALVAAVDRGSLSAAARELGVSAASVTRAVASIEERLGAELLRRTTRSLRLTEAGDRYLAVARRVLADLDLAEQSAREARATPSGLLTVTAPLSFGSKHVRPLVDEFLRAYPEARARLLLLDRVVSVVDEGVDVAVRIAHLPDSALLSVALGSVRRVVVASPSYLAEHGRPASPADLSSHLCVSIAGLTPSDAWAFGPGPAGDRARQVKIRPVLTVNVADAAVAAAEEGVGLTCALSYQVADAVAAGRLVPLLTAHEPPPLPVHLVYPQTSASTAKVRAFVDLAAPRLRLALGQPLGRRRAAARPPPREPL